MSDEVKPSGLFIAIEGPEGSGKSTQIKLLVERFLGQHYNVVSTKEPGGTKQGIDIRKKLLDGGLEPDEELGLFLLDRTLHVTNKIRPALADGAIVVTDRFSPSTIAYQHFGRGMNLSSILRGDEKARGGGQLKDGLEPDMTIIVMVSVDVMRQRVASRGERLTAFEKLGDDFHQRVIDGFQEMADKGFPFRRMIAIDGTRSIDEIHEYIWSLVIPWLEVRTLRVEVT